MTWETAQNESQQITGDGIDSTIQTDNNTFTYVDGYCERGGNEKPLAEPLNLITNIAFVIAAIMAFRLLKYYKQITTKNWDLIVLTAVLFCIGIGSSAFHAFPNQVGLLVDVIPITIFIHLYLVSFFIRIVGMKWYYAIVVLLMFVGVGILFENNFSRDTLNGTIMYVPTYLTLIIMILILGFVKQSPLYLHLINTAVIWTFSLSFRTIDLQLCNITQGIGTHFLWHVLNAIVLYRLVMLLLVSKLSTNGIEEVKS